MPSLIVDVDAFCAYGLILVVGSMTAVRATLAPFPGELRREAWMVPATWGVLLGYLIAPLVVFWILDATGASSDTSLVTALIVGISSHAILSGQDPKTQLPEGVTGWWQRFLSFAGKTSAQVSALSARDRKRTYEVVIRRLQEDPQHYAAMEELVRASAPDPAAVDAALAAITTSGAAAVPPLSDAVIRQKRARHLLGNALLQEDAERRMADAGIIPRGRYLWFLRGWRSVTVLLSVLAILGMFAFWGVGRLLPSNWIVSYSLTRLTKANASELDAHRARRRLENAMADPTSGVDVRTRLAQAIRRPGLASARIDLMIALILESGTTSDQQPRAIANDLIPALRATSPDAQSRVHHALEHLAWRAAAMPPSAAAGAPTPPPPTPTWDPIKEGSVFETARAVQEWTAYWAPRGK